MTTLLFILLAALAVGSAVSLVVQRNPLYCAISLIFVFMSLAGLYLTLAAPFIAAIQIIVYLISAIAETNRVPFDLPEAETELVAGFHTEYSALKFALFFMAEYINMFTVSVLATTLFLGGWSGPLVDVFPPLGVVYFLLKIFFFLFLYIWLRGTLPRFRFDQLMNFGWKFLLPVAILNVILTATVAFLWLR